MAILALEVKKLNPAFLTLKLGEFPIFDSFLNLANFLDLDNFLVFDNFSDFSINLSSLLTPPPSLVSSTLLTISTYIDIVVFSINVSDTTILQKLSMNHQ